MRRRTLLANIDIYLSVFISFIFQNLKNKINAPEILHIVVLKFDGQSLHFRRNWSSGDASEPSPTLAGALESDHTSDHLVDNHAVVIAATVVVLVPRGESSGGGGDGVEGGVRD